MTWLLLAGLDALDLPFVVTMCFSVLRLELRFCFCVFLGWVSGLGLCFACLCVCCLCLLVVCCLWCSLFNLPALPWLAVW